MTTVRMTDVLTLPNLISATGLLLVLRGSARAETGRGISMTVAGRLLDLLDGKVARSTGQTSEFGAAVDAAFDKAGVLAIGVNEWHKGIAPKPALLVIAAQNAVNLAATALVKRQRPDEAMEPSRDGKTAMAYQNGALGAYAVAALFRTRSPVTSRIFRVIGHGGTLVGTGWFGVRASTAYIRRLTRPTF